MTTVKNQLGQKLKELRNTKTLYQVESESGINRSQLRRYELGRIPEPEVLQRLADFYQVPYKELKALSFEDLFPKGSKDRALLLEWAKARSE